MKRDDILLLVTVLTLAELTLLLALAYRFYQLEKPNIDKLESASNSVSGFLGFLGIK